MKTLSVRSFLEFIITARILVCNQSISLTTPNKYSIYLDLSRFHRSLIIFKKKTNEKRELEENITTLGDEELAAKASLHQALNEEKVSLAELEQFSDLKAELNKLGISLEDIQHFVRTIQGVRQLGYSVDNIVRVVSNLEASSAIQAELEKRIRDLTVNERDLQE
ncbi:MAG: hypothetical protein M3044_08445, partial [Thermoproteota archaeon]|nr:hypothetical protein [Thermoproteota archaeon]